MKCNVCGQLLKDKSDYIEIKKEWGYFSDKDTQIHEFRICEKCYDRIVKQFEIPPRVTEKRDIIIKGDLCLIYVYWELVE